MDENSAPKLGIDFGTCRSSAAILIGNNLMPVHLGYGSSADIPTAIYIDQDGTILVGEEAVNTRHRDASRYLDRFKLRIASGGASFFVGGERRSYQWHELIAAVLLHIRIKAEEQFNNRKPLTQVVLTVPAMYAREGPAWKAMEKAASLAGFIEVSVVREPHAAAMYYDFMLRDSRTGGEGDGKMTLVYDLGGGTFDPALIRRRGTGYELVRGVEFDEGVKCGGIFFDEKIREDVLRKCPAAKEPLPQVRYTADGSIAAEDVKLARKLANNGIALDQFVLSVKHRFSSPDVREVNDPDPITGESDYKLRRDEFYALIASDLDRTIDCCRMLVERNGVSWEQISRILMVGGSCHIPLVREKLQAMVQQAGAKAEICWHRVGRTDRQIDPLMAVCFGAALAPESGVVAAKADADLEAEPALLERSKSILELGKSAEAVLDGLGEKRDELAAVVQRGAKRVATAQEPFRLGVVGDARAGKSTFINALAGERLAFTDVIEATPVMCLFRKGTTSGATIQYRSGTAEVVSVEEANRILSERRHDTGWIGSVKHVEFIGTTDGLHGIEAWDAPGFGGSDHNDVTAAEFLGHIGGAIWVFDCQFLGVASHIPPLESLKQAGKKVIAVVNKIDYLDGNEVDFALEEAKQRYGKYITAAAPLSSFQAFERALRGERDKYLDNVRDLVQRNILNSSETDRKRRITAAAEQAGVDISREIGKLLRTFRDRLGFLDHIRDNFILARRRMMALIPNLIESEGAHAFIALERRALDDLSKSYINRVSDLSQPADVDKLLAALRDASTFESEYRSAAERIANSLRAQWDRECLDAIQLSTAAIPKVSMGSRKDDSSDREKLRKEEAFRQGGVAGGLAAVALTAVVVTTSVALWPVVLAALPFGALVGLRKYHHEPSPVAESVQAQEEKIKRLCREHRRDLLEELSRNLPAKLSALLDTEIESIEASWGGKILGGTQEETFRKAANDLKEIHKQLKQKLPQSEMDSLLEARPLVIEAGYRGDQVWRTLFMQIESRLDIVLLHPETSLHKLLREIRPEVEVRLIMNADRGQQADLKAIVGDWPGKLSVRVVTMSDGSHLPLDASLLILDRLAIETVDSLGLVGEKKLQFRDYAHGLLAAERHFAELWEGKSSQFGEILIKPLSRNREV